MQGWGQDPFGRHEQRYFSAGRPTRLVRDGPAESYDDPPAGTAEPPGAAPPGAAPPGAAPPAPGPADVIGDAPGYGSAGPLPRASRARLFTVAGLAVAAVLTLVVAVGRAASTDAPAISPAAFVARSARHTLAERTAELTLSETVRAAGQSIPLTLTGTVDFGTGAMDVSGTYTYPGRPVALREILVGGDVYVATTVGGQSLTTRGRHWLATPAQQGPGAAPAYDDPVAALSALQQPGGAVRRLGAKTVGGVPCTGYAVAKDGQAYTVWADANGLVRAFSATTRWSAQASPPGTTSVAFAVNFRRYGSPVQITPPAASDTYSSGE